MAPKVLRLLAAPATSSLKRIRFGSGGASPRCARVFGLHNLSSTERRDEMKMAFFQWIEDAFKDDSIPTAETLARHYREMTDTAFSQLNPKDLTSVARSCYEAEAQFRAGKRKPSASSRTA